jgi:hypothetical protein
MMTDKKKGSKEKEERTCTYSTIGGESCGRHLYDGEHCIFHSKYIEGKKDKFNYAFWKEFERQKEHEEIYDFTGFVFPGDISFQKKEFEANAYFLFTEFTGEADFSYTQFSLEVSFLMVQFSGRANFADTQFSEKAYFGNAHFSGEALFYKAKFKEDANFENIKIEKYNSFNMIDTYFYNVSGLFEFVDANKKKFKYSNKTVFLPNNLYLILGEETTARYPIISRKIRDDMYLLRLKKKHPKMHFIWWLFADCSRSFFRWALWSLGIAIAFAFIYYFSYTDYLLNFQTIYVSEEFPLFSFIYYSIVTFTTLGFGDIVPRTGWLQFRVMQKVILGYIMLGGLISILANKLARRS